MRLIYVISLAPSIRLCSLTYTPRIIFVTFVGWKHKLWTENQGNEKIRMILVCILLFFHFPWSQPKFTSSFSIFCCHVTRSPPLLYFFLHSFFLRFLEFIECRTRLSLGFWHLPQFHLVLIGSVMASMAGCTSLTCLTRSSSSCTRISARNNDIPGLTQFLYVIKLSE